VDDRAQQRVAGQMRRRAAESNPDYVLNAGDNFYWGGIQTLCGARPYAQVDTGQWGPIYEEVYRGPGLDGKQWLGVLGNHDYGGFTFSSGWDQVIGYTWGGPPPCTGRWMTPAQYWSARAEYPDFSVDYFFLDTNVFDAFDPHDNPDHNICSLQHTPNGASCGAQGPSSVWDCPAWFRRLWRDQTDWLQRRLSNSSADWQVAVTHFPPTFGRAGWERLVERHGIDLIVSGHVHQQEVHYMEAGNFLRPTAWIVSGGGGGITSEGVPDAEGADDQYGFFDITLFKEEILIQAISHGGQVRSGTKVLPRKADIAARLPEAKGRKEDVIVVGPKLERDPEGHGGDFAASRPALLQDGEPEEAAGVGHHVVVGMLASSRRSGHPDASSSPHGVDPVFLSFAYGALLALLGSVGFASYRFVCRERLGSNLLCLGRGCSAERPCRGADKSGCWATPGYSSLSTDAPEQTREDQDERTVCEESAVEVPDEFTKPQDLGCMCWPTRSGGARYQRLQPA